MIQTINPKEAQIPRMASEADTESKFAAIKYHEIAIDTQPRAISNGRDFQYVGAALRINITPNTNGANQMMSSTAE